MVSTHSEESGYSWCDEKRDLCLRRLDKTILISLREDRRYSRSQIEEALKSVGEEKVSADKILDGFKSFAKEFKSWLRASGLKLEKLDIPLPRFYEDGFFVGELVGEYDYGEEGVRIRIEPKIGWEAYDKMIREVLKMLSYVTPAKGFLSSVLSTVTLFKQSSMFYSSLLLELTSSVLHSPLPPMLLEEVIVSEGSSARPVIPATIKFQARGIPLAYYKKPRIGLALYPLILIARFNVMIARDLEELASNISKTMSSVADKIREFADSHWSLLAVPTLRDAYQYDLRLKIPDEELIEEVRGYSRFNPLLGVVAELYEGYLASRSLYEKAVERGRRGMVMPVSSSKLYELWVLSRIIDYITSRGLATGFTYEPGQDHMSFKVYADRVTIEYNIETEGRIAKAFNFTIRPDIVVRVAGRGVLVVDAKYKEEIEREDVHRMITYVAELAEPIELGDRRVLEGVFAYMGRNTREPGERSLEGVVITLKACNLDPRSNNTQSGVECILERLVKAL
ncbi:MAG: hypothetical protein ABWJ42_03630 [Sulfolobales archaeon]